MIKFLNIKKIWIWLSNVCLLQYHFTSKYFPENTSQISSPKLYESKLIKLHKKQVVHDCFSLKSCVFWVIICGAKEICVVSIILLLFMFYWFPQEKYNFKKIRSEWLSCSCGKSSLLLARNSLGIVRKFYQYLKGNLKLSELW